MYKPERCNPVQTTSRRALTILLFFLVLSQPITAVKTQKRVEELTISNNFVFSCEIAKKYYPDTRLVYVVRGDIFPDALVAGPVAARDKAPILLVNPKKLPEPVEKLFEEKNFDRAIIIGGPEAVSPRVEEKLARFAKVSRIWGGDRYETAAKTAEQFWGEAEKALIVSGDDFSHSIPATTLAHSMKAPILLTKPGFIPRATEKALETLSTREVVLLGDTSVISPRVEKQLRENYRVSRLAGSNGYETSRLVAEHLHRQGWHNTYIAPGEEFQPVVVVGPVAASVRAVMLASKPKKLGPQVWGFITKHTTANNVVVTKGLPQQELDLFALRSLIPLIKNVLSSQAANRKLLDPFIPCRVNINISSGEKYHLKFDDWEKLDFLSGESSDPLLEVRVERETFNMLTRGRNSLEDLKRIYIEALRDGRIKVDGHGVKGWMAKKALEKLPGML